MSPYCFYAYEALALIPIYNDDKITEIESAKTPFVDVDHNAFFPIKRSNCDSDRHSKEL